MSLQGIIASVLSGGIFAAGWFVLIDGYGIGTTIVHDAQSLSTQGYAWLPPFAATVMFLCINAMLWSELFEDPMSHDSSTVNKARLFLYFALVCGFAGIIGAAFILASFTSRAGSYEWAGISCLVSTLMICFAAFLMRFLTLPPPRHSY